MVRITIKCGMRQTEREYMASPSIDELKNDRSLREELGFSDNVRVLVSGVEQSGFTRIPHGCVVTIETAANTKAA